MTRRYDKALAFIVGRRFVSLEEIGRAAGAGEKGAERRTAMAWEVIGLPIAIKLVRRKLVSQYREGMYRSSPEVESGAILAKLHVIARAPASQPTPLQLQSIATDQKRRAELRRAGIMK